MCVCARARARVYSYKSNAWEPQTGIKVLKIEAAAPAAPAAAKRVVLVDETVARDELRRVRALASVVGWWLHVPGTQRGVPGTQFTCFAGTKHKY